MAFASLPEKILLLLLICASAAGFWIRFRRVLRIVLAAKPDAGFALGDLAPRLKNFIWEVLFQGKVIAQRPVAGVAHAFVFWGFLAFGLITLNHLAMGFGFPLFTRESVFGAVYYGFVAIFALLVACSISWLTFRRFVIRPIWLGKTVPESGIIAGLILTLMLTYLAALVQPETTLAGHLIWWAHTLALLVFLPLVAAHQAFASGAELGYHHPETRRLQRYPKAWREMKILDW